MLQEAIDQVSQRLPPSKNTFKKLSYLSPKLILCQLSRKEFADLPLLHLTADKTEEIEGQYRKLIFVDWRNKEHFAKQEFSSISSQQFWNGVAQHPLFKDLATYAWTCLALPVSTAVVEEVFSLAAAVQTKPRNRMQLQMLDAIVRIRAKLIFSEQCCNNFAITNDMIQNFKADITYGGSELTNDGLILEESDDSIIII